MMTTLLSLEIAAWAVVLPILVVATCQVWRRDPGERADRVWALFAFGLGLVARLAVPAMPSDVRPDVGLGPLALAPFSRFSAIKIIVWRVVRWFGGSQLATPWDRFVLLDVFAASFAVLAVFRFARRSHGDRTTAFAAALLVALSPAAIRFSASESPSVLAMLFLALALDSWSLAARSRERLPLVVAVGWFAALAEIRAEGPFYALGGVLFLIPVSAPLVRRHWRLLASAAAAAATLTTARLLLDFDASVASDVAPPVNLPQLLWKFAVLPFSVFTGPLWGAMCLAALTVHAWRDRSLLAWRMAGLLTATWVLINGFNLFGIDHATNVRYYLPALVLAATPIARGLSLMIAQWTAPVARWRAAVVLVAVLVAPGGTWGLLRTSWAAQAEFAFLRAQLPTIPNDCLILTRAMGERKLGALEVGESLSQAFGRGHRWLLLRDPGPPARPATPTSACSVYYRGGRCALARWAMEDSAAPDDCRELESGWKMTALSGAWIDGEPIVSETFRTRPYRVGFFRVEPIDATAAR